MISTLESYNVLTIFSQYKRILPFLNQSAIFVGFVVGFLNVLPYTLAELPPSRLNIIFDLEMVLVGEVMNIFEQFLYQFLSNVRITF